MGNDRKTQKKKKKKTKKKDKVWSDSKIPVLAFSNIFVAVAL